MASTYSTNLKIELQATGENSGTWGTITNTNLGTALEQAIVGYGNPSYASDANLTLTYTDTNAAQAARALVLNVTSSTSLTTTRELVVPTIQKQYIVQNNTSGSQSITVKTSAGTGITVPNGRKAHLYVDGTNVIYMDDYVDINGGAIDGTPIGASSASTGAFTTLTASTPVGVSSGGTGQSTYTDGQLLIGNSSGNTLTKATLTAGTNVTITNGNGSITIASTNSGGDVVGPASATDEALVRFDLTTGKLVQNSNATLTDAGALTLTNGAVINEAGADSDTRIEGDTDVELVFVDASTDRVGFGTSTPGSKVDIKGTLRLSGSSSGYVGLSPAAAAGSTTYTLPSADGTSGQLLSTNGSGTLSWATAGGGAQDYIVQSYGIV